MTATAAAPTEDPVPEVQKPPSKVDFVKSPDYAFSKENVDTFCREENTKRGELNQSMFNYCVSKETTGHADMLDALKRLSGEPWLQPIFPMMWNEWTKRGITRYSMVAYSLKKEEDSYKTYVYDTEHQAAPSAKFASCEAKWRNHSKRWTMTNYCVKKD